MQALTEARIALCESVISLKAKINGLMALRGMIRTAYEQLRTNQCIATSYSLHQATDEIVAMHEDQLTERATADQAHALRKATSGQAKTFGDFGRPKPFTGTHEPIWEFQPPCDELVRFNRGMDTLLDTPVRDDLSVMPKAPTLADLFDSAAKRYAPK